MFNWYFPLGLGILFLVVWVFRGKPQQSKQYIELKHFDFERPQNFNFWIEPNLRNNDDSMNAVIFRPDSGGTSLVILGNGEMNYDSILELTEKKCNLSDVILVYYWTSYNPEIPRAGEMIPGKEGENIWGDSFTLLPWFIEKHNRTFLEASRKK